jgi:hypothetical protein
VVLYVLINQSWFVSEWGRNIGRSMKKGLDYVVFEMIVLLLHSLCHDS